MLKKIGLIGLFVLPVLGYSDTTTSQFTAGVDVSAGPAPFDITVTDLSFGQVMANPAGCNVSLSFNGTEAGLVGGNCDGYSGVSQVGEILLDNATQHVFISSVSINFPQTFALSNGSEVIESTVIANPSADLNGASFSNCSFDPPPGPPFPTSCTIYFGNVSLSIPVDAPAGTYSTALLGGHPLEVVINYN